MSLSELVTVRAGIHAVLRITDDGPAVTIGFIEKVGSVYVSLVGPDLARAVEVRQSLSREQAVAAVRNAAC